MLTDLFESLVNVSDAILKVRWRRKRPSSIQSYDSDVNNRLLLNFSKLSNENLIRKSNL